LITLSPLLILIFYQWTLKDSWASTLLSVLTLVALLGLVAWPAYRTVQLARRRGASDLYNPDEPHPYAPLYGLYRNPRYYFFLVTLTETIIRSVLISLAKANATAQIALVVALEGLVVLAFILIKPFKTRSGDVFGTYLAMTRFVSTGLMVGFLQPLAVSPIPRVVIGLIIAVILCVAVVITIANLVLNIGMEVMRRRKSISTEGTHSPKPSSEKSTVETGEQELDVEQRTVHEFDSQSQLHAVPVSRPTNPTPEQGVALDADNSILQPFPISPTATTVSTMDPPSLYSRRDSESITVGSLLPRRWSFSYSQPNSPTGSDAHGVSVPSSPGQTPTSEGYLSRRTSDSNHLAPAILSPSSSSPSAWAAWTNRRGSRSRPGSSGGQSIRSSRSGMLTRSGSTKLQGYQQNHERIPEVAVGAT